jgi:hypothetical protein
MSRRTRSMGIYICVCVCVCVSVCVCVCIYIALPASSVSPGALAELSREKAIKERSIGLGFRVEG